MDNSVQDSSVHGQLGTWTVPSLLLKYFTQYFDSQNLLMICDIYISPRIVFTFIQQLY